MQTILEQSAGEQHGKALRKRRASGVLRRWVSRPTIGTGIFALTGKAAGLSVGPAIVLSFVVAGIVRALAASTNCFHGT
jgi:APA family basic amino acid/polyamine antiporter